MITEQAKLFDVEGHMLTILYMQLVSKILPNIIIWRGRVFLNINDDRYYEVEHYYALD